MSAKSEEREGFAFGLRGRCRRAGARRQDSDDAARRRGGDAQQAASCVGTPGGGAVQGALDVAGWLLSHVVSGVSVQRVRKLSVR